MPIGIDLIEIKNLETKINENSGFLEHLLSDDECSKWQIQTLAGKIAAKEAIIKTGFLKPGEWLKVQILTDDSGKPKVYTAYGEIIKSLEISISHSQNIAIAIALYEEK